ncbi:adenosine deaminase [Cysteiniphilum sp. QT6929]|uniref:adenosine deaminase n=1 Tax=Cysteiniphilum sp. QT6929 TaxID=2975055 RepID=UPI0024B324FB|nr:adenosine deaminase [Cysteiniphilum sp. QT6929]WHN66193.1 adenosine deaminase [Cysteiniphilum sp. QT6929]
MIDFIKQLPKAELHVHIEGTLEPEHAFLIAQRNNISMKYKRPEDMVAAYNFHDLPSFLEIYYSGINVLRTELDFYELTYAYLEQASANGIVYAEIFFDPQAHTRREISFSTIINGITKAQEIAKSRLTIDSNLIMCFLRELSVESAFEHLKMAESYLSKIIGVGLDSNEKNNPPIKFKEVFAKAKAMGLKVTVHCDVNQENSIEHIRQAIEDIQADRIDHGINVLESNKLCAELINKNIGLTVCPVSNRYVVNSLTSKEIIQLLSQGIKVTINSDDPSYFNAYLNENLILLQQEGKLTKEHIIQLVKNSFDISWISDNQKQYYFDLLQKTTIQAAEA